MMPAQNTTDTMNSRNSPSPGGMWAVAELEALAFIRHVQLSGAVGTEMDSERFSRV